MQLARPRAVGALSKSLQNRSMCWGRLLLRMASNRPAAPARLRHINCEPYSRCFRASPAFFRCPG
jgi:hypothetical protein